MMKKVSVKMARRCFLKQAVAVTAGFGGLRAMMSFSLAADPLPGQKIGYGPVSIHSDNILELPEGFICRVISRNGERMHDGLKVPGLPDGMAAFPAPRGRTYLVRNHEINFDQESSGPWLEMDGDPGSFLHDWCYDHHQGRPCPGGTTTILYNTRTQKVEHQHLSLAGTLRNCAGGPTPWNSWITCEETVVPAGKDLGKDHGYNFEVPAGERGCIYRPVPLKAMGRFNHEAIAVDPFSGCVYQTEDRDDGCIYRFLPGHHDELQKGGQLQALAVRDRKGCDTRNRAETGRIPEGVSLDVEWINCSETDSPNDDLRYRMYDLGAAWFARGEGMWYGNGGIYFACTSGGPQRAGQVWKYTPSPDETRPGEMERPGRLELFIEPNDRKLLESADNLTVTPWGDVVICEDCTINQDCRAIESLVGVTPDGNTYRLARWTGDSELAGATFSPDGSTLFVNAQQAGLTLAITGPWHRRHAG
jgi:secreted PhoX family phosphatase